MTSGLPGIDISHHQSTVDFKKLAGKIDYCILKATDGISYVDPKFNARWAEAKANNIRRGAYHFFRPHQSADEQAKLFLSTTNYEDGDLLPALDLEIDSRDAHKDEWPDTPLKDRLDRVQRYLKLVEEAIGLKPMIYLSPSFVGAYLNHADFLADYPLWIANYKTQTPKVPKPWTRWTFWQYTSGGTIDGVSGNIDQDYFNGTEGDLLKLCKSESGNLLQAAVINLPSELKTDVILSEPVTADAAHLLFSTILFDGYKLHWTGDGAKDYEGFSGSPDESAKESTAEIGPTPQGKYAVDPANIENFAESDDWGSHRVRLEPYKPTVDRMTSCFGVVRTGMYIHGGSFKGTHGCIELNDDTQENDFFKKLKDYGRKIELEVKYTGERKNKYEDPRCKYS